MDFYRYFTFLPYFKLNIKKSINSRVPTYCLSIDLCNLLHNNDYHQQKNIEIKIQVKKGHGQNNNISFYIFCTLYFCILFHTFYYNL